MPCHIPPTYWTGPYGIKVPNYVNKVILGILIPEDQYKNLYAIYDPVNRYWVYCY